MPREKRIRKNEEVPVDRALNIEIRETPQQQFSASERFLKAPMKKRVPEDYIDDDSIEPEYRLSLQQCAKILKFDSDDEDQFCSPLNSTFLD